MKARLGTKTIAVILCAAMLALALSCGAGVALLAGYGYLAGAESYVEMDAATTATGDSGYPTVSGAAPSFAAQKEMVPAMDAVTYLNTAPVATASVLYGYHGWLYAGIALGLLLFGVLLVYLCAAAGRTTGSQVIRPGGLNRVPLDLYTIVWAVGAVSAGMLVWQTIEYDLDVPTVLLLFVMYLASLLTVGYLFAISAQAKAGEGYWWKNSLLVWVLNGIGKAVKWTVGKLVRFFTRVYNVLPMAWQWLLTGTVLFLLLAVGVATGSAGVTLFAVILYFAAIFYGTYCFGKLRRAARAMGRGNLNAKVSLKLMTGAFLEFSEDLNALGDAALVAAQQQTKSEHMKAELITNVSHDLKTPLTSIINYIDLLQRAESPEQAQSYLEVLSRQSARMKKLIEDLVELSKATTGNLQADIQALDASETVNQALGEFADKFTAAGLTPVVNLPEVPVQMLADGRLAWRVMSNLFSNVVKYAMPGTRIYIDVVPLELAVTISVKNVSREALNLGAEELMERFVRGDTSRNTEGSGLGLNIAKSLMELQNGQLQLLVDGDLFKATLFFPRPEQKSIE